MLMNGFEKIRIFDRLGHHQIHIPPEQGLQAKQQAEIVVRRMAGFKRLELNQKIKVAGVFVKLLRNSRAEQLKSPNVVLLT